MKSWISFLLPDDEYRERKILYYLAEGAIFLVLLLIGLFISSRYIPILHINLEVSIFLAIWVFIGYVFIRYILSGMEHADIATDQAYSKQLKFVLSKSVSFVIIFNLVFLLFMFPDSLKEWLGNIGVSIVGGLILFFVEYLSLKKSYEKNKELL
ncbi:DUF3278 domain-containing protein [Ornithinibacillus halotolerans]|uniref:DUF3278 domain-containing protein n=1 Tax=Ornithinibacillus halotolerans TaxID=1274357 RepID=A0A916S1A1_9BACI|nr:DUF3278 domain-containing protein [Ornithinibacillus halotolerans]GGA80018.1 hypothetical protein GCM10008025_24280 [Ornithinibacillus halotolerans]